MRELTVDLWDVQADWKCITTNGFVKRDGTAVMGRGCAREAAQRFRRANLPWLLGERIRHEGNHVHLLLHSQGVSYFSFPVKHHWWERADLPLIEQSCQELRTLWENSCEWEQRRQESPPLVALPRPGCGNGQLAYTDVKLLLERYFPEDAFLILEKPARNFSFHDTPGRKESNVPSSR